jgi:putative hydrolase of the HAD superfamily
MRKKAIIIDLDNTIYPVSSIGDKLFKTLFSIIYESGEYSGDFDKIKSEIMRRPFQFVADEFLFSESLKSQGISHLSEKTYEDRMQPFDDYIFVRTIPCKKFLVTTGFPTMQHSKIKQLGIEDDFEEIFIIDPGKSDITKKDIFSKILTDNNYSVDDVLVVGDDLNSEIKAAKALGIDNVLYDYKREHIKIENQVVISDFRDLQFYI